MDEERYQTLKALLLTKKNVILQGAPGVGKTFAAKRLAYSIMGFRPTTPNESVAGMLLYAGMDDEIQPNNDYQISGNTISVQTLDLDCGFIDIANRLDAIAARVEPPGELERYRKNVILDMREHDEYDSGYILGGIKTWPYETRP